MSRQTRNCMGGTIKRSRGFGRVPSRTNARAYLLFLFITYGSVAC